MIGVYLVDDHPFLREGLKTYLATHQKIEVLRRGKLWGRSN